MKNKIVAGALAGATLATGAVIPTLSNANQKTPVHNDVLLSQPVSNISGQEAVVINGNNNLALFSSANGEKTTSYVSTGQMLTLMSKEGNFYKVTVHETGAVGYISASNMQVIESGLNAPFKQNITDGSVINVSTAVHLRAQPDLHAGILRNLKNGTSLEILGTQGQWVKVNVSGTIGYIYESYVSTGNGAVGTQNSNTISGNTTATNQSNTNGNTTAKATSTSVNKGTDKTVNTNANSNANKNKNENQNKTNNAQINGILHGSQSETSNSAINVAGYIKGNDNAIIYSAKNVNDIFTNQASSNSPYNKTLKTENVNVTILNKKDNFYEVKLPNGTTGFVNQNYIVFSGNTPKAKYLNELNELSITTYNLANSDVAQQSQSSMNMYSYKAAQMWNNQLTSMYNHLMKVLPQAKAEQLKTSEAQFLANRKAAVDAGANEYKGGSIVPLIENSIYASQTQQRCYELANNYSDLYSQSVIKTEAPVNANTNLNENKETNTGANSVSNTTEKNNASNVVNNNKTISTRTKSTTEKTTNKVDNKTSDTTTNNNNKVQNNIVNTKAENNTVNNNTANNNKANVNNSANNKAATNSKNNENYNALNQEANNQALSSSTLDNLVYTHIFDAVAPCRGHVSYSQISNIIKHGTEKQKQDLLQKYGYNCLVVNTGGSQSVTPSTFYNGHFYYTYSCTNLYSAINNPNAQFKFTGVIDSAGHTPSVSAYNNAISNHDVYALGLGQPAWSVAQINC